MFLWGGLFVQKFTDCMLVFFRKVKRIDLEAIK